jgi:hypothetical protein
MSNTAAAKQEDGPCQVDKPASQVDVLLGSSTSQARQCTAASPAPVARRLPAQQQYLKGWLAVE